MIEPHHVHLLEMRAARPDATAGEMLRAYNTASNFAAGIDEIEPDEPPDDATARHLAEMRAGREVQGG